MQTFLPWPDFRASARDLDTKRLGKQRVETLQLLQSRLRWLQGNKKSGWYNHPARVMWELHEPMLAVYGLAVCEEWTLRGYKDSCSDKIVDTLREIVVIGHTFNPFVFVPDWFSEPRLFESHRAALLRKQYSHYRNYVDTCDPSQEYFWPGTPQTVADEDWQHGMLPIDDLLDRVAFVRAKGIYGS